MSTVQDQQTDHARFVADARRHYVPVARWARANGWDMPNWRNWNRGIEIHTDHAWRQPGEHFELAVILNDATPRQSFHPTSVKQAIDFLVDAEVLPAEMHSLLRMDPRNEIPSIGDVKKWAGERWDALSFHGRIDLAFRCRKAGWDADWNAILVEVQAVTR